MITIRVTEARPPMSVPFPEHGTRGASLYSVAVPLYAAYGSNMDPGQMKERARIRRWRVVGGSWGGG